MMMMLGGTVTSSLYRNPLRSLTLVRWKGSSSATKKVKEYDLVIIGSGPAATQCAIDARSRRKTVAIVDKKTGIGGVCVHTGTIPSKTFREAVLHFTGYRHRGFYGKSYSFSRKAVTLQDILGRVHTVIGSEMDAISARLKAAQVDIVSGHATFNCPDTVSVTSTKSDEDDITLKASKFLIACGTRPATNPLCPTDGKLIFDSDQILADDSINSVPKSLIVIGAGVIGMEYASMINLLPGTTVTVIDAREEALSFADSEIISSLKHDMSLQGARFLLGESLVSVEKSDREVVVHLASGKTVRGDGLLYSVGRQANTDGLNLSAVGLEKNKRGLISVNECYQTTRSHIYAAGDCIGAPSLASTSLEQGRLASCSMWDESSSVSQLESDSFPYGIYTIPEISMVGKTEAELTSENVNYSVGVSKYSELAKGQMLGGYTDQCGMLKILFDSKTLDILGVHAIGEGATEIIHIGQVAMNMNCKLTYFRDAIFNYPTLAEAYRVAAFDGLSQVRYQ